MSRFLFLLSCLTAALSFVSSASLAQAPSGSSGSVSASKRTLDEAVTEIQSKEPHSGSSFRLIRELHSSATWREDATGEGSVVSVCNHRDGALLFSFWASGLQLFPDSLCARQVAAFPIPKLLTADINGSWRQQPTIGHPTLQRANRYAKLFCCLSG